MPMKFVKGTAHLSGECGLGEVEELISWLEESSRPKVNLQHCTHLHGAILQVLLAGKPQITAKPKDSFLAQWVLPLLKS